jgi:hypothetical protein
MTTIASAFLMLMLISCSELALRRQFHTEAFPADSLTVMGDGSSYETGCWLRLYDERNFNGNDLLLHSGRGLRSLKFDNLEDWRARIRSFELGPHAEVTFYNYENYKNPLLTVAPARRFRGQAGLSIRNARSIRLTCLKESALRTRTQRELDL